MENSNVTALFTKGEVQYATKYKPNILTLIIGKMLEPIIKEVITAHLENHNLVKQHQHGFMKGKSYLTNLLEFFKEDSTKVHRGEPVDVLYLGFQKAFDKVPHKRLSHKIRAHVLKVIYWHGTKAGMYC